jgi:hypothetical protein
MDMMVTELGPSWPRSNPPPPPHPPTPNPTPKPPPPPPPHPPPSDMDMMVTELAAALPVTVLPGADDPANVSLPQQPLHACLFPGAAPYSSARPRAREFRAGECAAGGASGASHFHAPSLRAARAPGPLLIARAPPRPAAPPLSNPPPLPPRLCARHQPSRGRPWGPAAAGDGGAEHRGRGQVLDWRGQVRVGRVVGAGPWRACSAGPGRQEGHGGRGRFLPGGRSWGGPPGPLASTPQHTPHAPHAPTSPAHPNTGWT